MMEDDVHRTDCARVRLRSGRSAIVHTAGSAVKTAPMVVMHYGTPHTGRHPTVFAQLAEELGVRLIAASRPGFAGSDRHLGRSVADAAADVVEVLEGWELRGEAAPHQVLTVGYSGGGPHALAFASLLPGRVREVGVFGCPAPYDGSVEWFAGMAGNGGGLRPAAEGREAREEHQSSAEFDPESFTAADRAALDGRWASIGEDAQAAFAFGSDLGEIDDDLAFVAPWEFDLDRITARVSLFQAEDDRIIPSHHAARLKRLLPGAEARILQGSGHVEVLDALPEWLKTAVARLS